MFILARLYQFRYVSYDEFDRGDRFVAYVEAL